MKYELLTIEDGVVISNKNTIFSKLYLQIFQSDIISIILDSVAEKSSLINLFEGAPILVSGKLFSLNKKIPLENSSRFMRENVAVIGHVNNLISSLKLQENIYLFSSKDVFILKKKFNKQFSEIVDRFGLSPELRNATPPFTFKQIITIELLKAYVEKKKIVLLCDLSGLIRKELDELHELLAQLKNTGMSFVILEPVESVVSEWLSQIYIIRRGQTVRILDAKTADRQMIHSIMLNNGAGVPVAKNNSQAHSNRTIIEFRDVYTRSINDFSLSVRAGEVVKMLYVDDQSCEGIIDMLNGSDPLQFGQILLNNNPIRIKNIYHATRQGICFIYESPYNNMLFYNMNVRDNLAIALSHKKAGLWLHHGCMKSIDDFACGLLNANIMHKKLRTLDPSTLQQIAYLKWLLYAAKVVVCIRPLNEIDIHLTEITVNMIQELINNGTAVLVLSPDISSLNKIRGTSVYFKSGRMITEEQYNRYFYQ